jgi:hypothetical protein
LVFELFAQLELAVAQPINFLLFRVEVISESESLLLDQTDLFLGVVRCLGCSPQIQYLHFGLLQILFEFVDLLSLALSSVPEFPDLVLEGCPLILKVEGQLSELPIEYTFPLAVHGDPHVLYLLGATPLGCSKPDPPVVDVCHELIVPGPLHIVLVSKAKVDCGQLCLELLQLAVQLLADQIHFFVFLQVLFATALVAVDAVAQLSDLHLVVLAVEVQLLDVPQLYAARLHLLR